MEDKIFYHALQVDEKKCEGCSNCMKICPTEAIRMHNGVAKIQEHRCIDCGKCYEACPYSAIYIKQDDFDEIFNYDHRVALVPAVFLGQFPEEISTSRIYAALKDLGFNHVFEIESSVNIYAKAKNKYAMECQDKLPLISSFCPAILRLIQVKYPSLVDNLIPLKPPVDISAMYAQKYLMDQGVPKEEIGLFYVTPCAAKIAAVKNPVGEDRSIINGVINMDMLFNRVFKKIKEQGKSYIFPQLRAPRLSADAILSTLTNGERRLCMAKRSFAIDGIENVMDFLEKLENDEIEGVEFLELRVCDQSCAGGILSCDNRFLIGERMYQRARKVAERERNGEMPRDREMEQETEYLMKNVRVGKIKPRSMMILDDDISKAIEKMEKINKLTQKLPQIDCSLCGAPTCDALAADVAAGSAKLTNCVFIQRLLEREKKLDVSDSMGIMEDIWGEKKFDDLDAE